METSNLIIGNIYSLKFSDLPYFWIIKVGSKPGLNDIGIYNSPKPYFNSACNFGGKSYKNGQVPSFKEATFEEKQWLNQCILKDKFISFNQIKFEIEYEIY